MKGRHHPDTMHVAGPTAPPGVTDESPERYCCMGEAINGPTRCTCWEPIFSGQPTAPPDTSTEPGTRAKCCHDCAYRQGSPERAAGEGEDLEALAASVSTERAFWCHQGMARVVAWVHPDGTRIEYAGGDHYVPLILDGVPYLLDGRPGERCAGWAALRA